MVVLSNKAVPESRAVAEHYLAVYDGIRDRGLDGEVSVKLTQLDPYARWATHWLPDNLDPKQFPLPFFGFEGDDFFRIAEALQVDSMSAITVSTMNSAAASPISLGALLSSSFVSSLTMACRVIA